jgi:hypothetical protein
VTIFTIVPVIVAAVAMALVVVVPFLAVWFPYRAMRGRARLRRMLEDQGYLVERMELRWLTRGPFSDMVPAGLKHSNWLYRVRVVDREARPRVAWIRWCQGWPWQSDDRWQLHWAEDQAPHARGVATPVFAAIVVSTMAVILVPLILSARGAAPAGHEPVAQSREAPADQIVQRYVCERSYTNFAMGYRHSGIYVDRDGRVTRFSVETRLLPTLPPWPLTQTALEATYGSELVPLRTVARPELLAMFRLIPAAAKGRYSPRVSGGADLGSLSSVCYMVDAGDGRYREVELDVTGDWSYRNLAPEAQTLAKWLAALAQPEGSR